MTMSPLDVFKMFLEDDEDPVKKEKARKKKLRAENKAAQEKLL